MKKFFCLSLIFAATACTPQMEEAMNKEWHALKTYDAYPVLAMTGFTHLKTPQERTELALKQDCLEQGQRRVATFSGASSPFYYTQCPYTPYFPDLPLTRLQPETYHTD